MDHKRISGNEPSLVILSQSILKDENLNTVAVKISSMEDR